MTRNWLTGEYLSRDVRRLAKCFCSRRRINVGKPPVNVAYLADVLALCILDFGFATFS
jgi:hypothetical protein